MDLFDIPDKVQAVMDEMLPHLAEHVCGRAGQEGYPGVCGGGWRGAPAMLSPEMWNRFYWPYFRKLVYEVAEKESDLHSSSRCLLGPGIVPFRELPKGRVLMALDGYTDIFSAKKALDGHMCIMGDVPATMFSFEDPEIVYNYSARLIRETGRKDLFFSQVAIFRKTPDWKLYWPWWLPPMAVNRKRKIRIKKD